ncbi:MAG: hypothetical protein DSM106950_32740 [Stigonema ocellatum SAG 48.90 = DSM 106950]|nr:hypothetical protein [Stigonema ocellatum SAG 48.90 = DSM 106950]
MGNREWGIGSGEWSMGIVQQGNNMPKISWDEFLFKKLLFCFSALLGFQLAVAHVH